jgi:hypothetical protein
MLVAGKLGSPGRCHSCFNLTNEAMWFYWATPSLYIKALCVGCAEEEVK